MENTPSESIYLKKLIDIPRSIVRDLKFLAINADKTLKVYIQDLLADEVKKYREKR